MTSKSRPVRPPARDVQSDMQFGYAVLLHMEYQAMSMTLVALQSDPGTRIGERRIRLLEAIGTHGSISAAARAVGVSYRAAWDSVQALNNVLGCELVRTRPGGRAGGSSFLTEEGEEVIRSYRSVQGELTQTLARAAKTAGTRTPASLRSLVWGVHMRTTARNSLRGVIRMIQEGVVDSEIVLELVDGVELAATVTTRSVRDLALSVGQEAVALIKSSFVILAREDNIGRTTARNRLCGRIIRREDTEVTSDIELDLGYGRTVAAVVTRTSADALGLVVGDRACALIKASHVILAID